MCSRDMGRKICISTIARSRKQYTYFIVNKRRPAMPPRLPTVLYTKCRAGLADWLWLCQYVLRFPSILMARDDGGAKRRERAHRRAHGEHLSRSVSLGARCPALCLCVCALHANTHAAHRKTAVAVTVYCSRKRRRPRAAQSALSHAHAKHTDTHRHRTFGPVRSVCVVLACCAVRNRTQATCFARTAHVRASSRRRR